MISLVISHYSVFLCLGWCLFGVWFLYKSLKQFFSSAAPTDLTCAVYWLSASNASEQITLSIVAIICRDAAAGLKCNSQPLEIISLPLFPFSSRRSVSSIFSGNFNLLILIQQPNGFCNQSVLCKTGTSPPTERKLLCISYHTDPTTFNFFWKSQRV